MYLMKEFNEKTTDSPNKKKEKGKKPVSIKTNENECVQTLLLQLLLRKKKRESGAALLQERERKLSQEKKKVEQDRGLHHEHLFEKKKPQLCAPIILED